MNDFDKKNWFLINQPKYLIKRMSKNFPFTWSQLRKYKNILEWKSVSNNMQIEWSIDIIGEFKEYWGWKHFVFNEKVIGNASIRNYFQSQLEPYLTEQDISDMIDKNFGFGEYNKDAFTQNTLYYNVECSTKFKERLFQSVDEIESAKNINWSELSGNLLLPWSIELIEKYKDKWNWWSLCKNEMIPWNEKMIAHFIDKIIWGKWVKLDFNCKRLYEGLSNNKAIKWNSKLINHYHDCLEFREVSRSPAALWNINLLLEFQNFWCYGTLPLNNTLWNKVFFEFDDAEMVNNLDIIFKNKSEKN